MASITAGGVGTRPPVGTLKRNPAAPWWHVDVVLVASTIVIATIGLLMVYSSTESRLEATGGDSQYYLKRQAAFILIGIAAMALTALVDYRYLRDFSAVFYCGAVAALLAVISPLGSTSGGAQAWFQLGGYQLQPSEFAKIAFIVCIAAYAAQHKGELDIPHLGVILALAAVPLGLVYRQPDLGTALVFVAILMVVLAVAGARARHLAVLALIGVTGVFVVFQIGVLKEYQLDRLNAFLDQEGDSRRVTYNLNQSKIAISNGGLTGKGLFKGTQTNLQFVPAQHTDFVFTAVGEELGFVGAASLLALFAIVVWRTWRTAALAKDLFGTLVCVGVLAMFVFQLFENVGMTMGIMPVTGIPLPMVSYGGSSTIAYFIGIGLVLNVHMRRFS